MKRILCILLCILIAVLTLAACGNDAAGAGHLFTVVDEGGSEAVTALFSSTDSGETLEVEMTKSESADTADGATQFTCTVDTAKFDRVVLTAGSNSTVSLAVNDYVQGWVLGSRRFYPYDGNGTEPAFERVRFDYEDRSKDILIWTPEDYDQNSDKKYAVIYMTDAQNLFLLDATSTGSWGVAESVRSMMNENGEGCIIVGIENADGWRDSELTPDLGDVRDPSYEDGHGAYFSDFVVDTVMPYINENYNVYTDREHTHICGSSSGGIECFYIAMEHPDKFASVGALSPAFVLYSEEKWVEYLGEKDFSKGYPFIYLYCGNSSADSLEQMLYAGTVSMPETLKKVNYPEDKVVLKLSEDALHNEMHWRAVFPDYLKYAFPASKE